MSATMEPLQILEFIVDRINVGVFVVDRDMKVVLWNRFMEMNSGRKNAAVIGNNLFTLFPELPHKWLERKISNVFVLKNFAFTSWEQRPYLFKFPHNRPVTGGVDSMQQDCTFLPVKNSAGEVQFVCVTLNDATDTSINRVMMKDALKKLGEASNRDGLTSLFNRRYLEQSLIKEFDRYKRYGSALSIVMLDLDHFKIINDQYGHLAGDEVLRRTADILTCGVREADTAGRYGGEEFVLILPQTNLEGAVRLAERLRVNVEAEEIVCNGATIHVTISLGVTQMRDAILTHEELMQEADTCLYESKKQGRNRVTAR